MRIQIKGGVWKNSEDEVLKAAVMKYGLNNWSRVSSLLVNKSAKQCKARWYEWLNPYVKKTEWSREEEEKLLHLAKLFPTQWRTIGPLIGRTAYQCLQHYERLLDQAQGREEDEEFDPRRLRPGEIDPALECKPSRADAVDMDDDEKEMLAEARARLANTRGKKAKRKAREKALEQTKRIASLQKRRELKMAGVGVGALQLHKSIMEYATDIPFEQQPPKGFYPPDEDRKEDLTLKTMEQLEGKRRDEEMKRLRKDDIRKLKRLQNDDIPAAMAIFDKYEKSSIIKNKLILPEPTMTDDEINHIVKMGVDTQMLGNVVQSSIARTPMTSSIMEEARIAAAANKLQTPLEGEMNIDSSGFAVPQTPSQFQTPNPIRKLMGQTPLSIFSGRSSVMSTPMHSDVDSVSDADPIGRRARLDMARLYVKASLSNLPEPESELEITVPNVPLDVENVREEHDLDMDDVENEHRRKEFEELAESSVIRNGYPRPFVYNSIVFVNDLDGTFKDDVEPIRGMINEEFINLIASDSIKHPIPGGKPCTKPINLEKFNNKLLRNANDLLNHEIEIIKEGCGDITDELFHDVSISYSVDHRRYVPCERLNSKDQRTSEGHLRKEFENHLEELMKRNKTLENRYNVSTGGYRKREEKILGEINEIHESIVQLTTDLEAYNLLMSREKEAINDRITRQLALLQREKSLNHNLQRLYGEIARADMEECQT